MQNIQNDILVTYKCLLFSSSFQSCLSFSPIVNQICIFLSGLYLYYGLGCLSKTENFDYIGYIPKQYLNHDRSSFESTVGVHTYDISSLKTNNVNLF
jgi:hypothetical protein